MNTAHRPIPFRQGLLTPGAFVLAGLAALAFAMAVYRLLFGLGAATHLSNAYPWGIWIGLDVATGVALSAGGFTSAAVAHIFGRHRYEPLVRPALLTTLLGYTFAVLGLVLDLGRYYNIWHPMWPTMWQGNSVLFEVAMCVMAYLNVLYLEFTPIVCERFWGRVNLPGPLARFNPLIETVLGLAQSILGKVMVVFIIAGVVLSCMHQSSLGALLLIAPYKMNPLWYTPILPLLFLLSAVTVGFAMVTFESILSAWTFRRKPEMHLLTSYSRLIVVFLGIYMTAKLADLLVREAYPRLGSLDTSSILFLIEMGMGIVLPWIMLTSLRVRRSPALLFFACALVVGGVALNRVNVFLVAFHPPYASTPYFPSIPEMVITTGLVAGLVLAYRVCVTLFPVLPVEEESEDQEMVLNENRSEVGSQSYVLP